MICPKCKEDGRKSTIQRGMSMTTAMYCPSYYDEDGNYHNHNRNTTTTYYECSNGHHITVSEQGTCPSYPEICDYHNEPIITVS